MRFYVFFPVLLCFIQSNRVVKHVFGRLAAFRWYSKVKIFVIHNWRKIMASLVAAAKWLSI